MDHLKAKQKPSGTVPNTEYDLQSLAIILKLAISVDTCSELPAPEVAIVMAKSWQPKVP